MVEVADGSLAAAVMLPIVAGVVLWPFAARGMRWVTAALGALALLVSCVLLVGCLRHMLDVGGWSAIPVMGSWTGARLIAADPTGRIGFVLDPLTAMLALAIAVTGTVAHLSSLSALRGGARRGNDVVTSGQLAGQLVTIGCLLAIAVGDSLLTVAVGFVMASVTAWALLVGDRPERPPLEGAGRLFTVHRLGDAALLCALVVARAGFTTLRLDDMGLEALEIDPWMRALTGPFAGFPARTLWTIVASLVVVAAGTRLALVPLPALTRDATSAPAPTLVIVHALAGLAAGGLLLVRLVPTLNLAPEVRAALGVLAALTALASALFALTARDVVRCDVHLLTSAASIPVIALSQGEVPGAVLGIVWLCAVALPLLSSSGTMLEATGGQGDLFLLGGLWKPLRMSDATRALATLCFAAIPGFTGYFVLEHTLWAALASPRGSVVVFALALAAMLASAIAAWRSIHLVFSGTTLRAPLPLPLVDLPLWRAVLPIATALCGLLLGIVCAVPRALFQLFERFTGPATFDEPLGVFLGPGLVLARRTLSFVAPTEGSPSPLTHEQLLMLLTVIMLLGYGISAALYRSGPTALHARIFRSRTVQKLSPVVATAARPNEQVTRGVSEGALRLSRLLGVQLFPVVLETLLQRIPALIAFVIGASVRLLHNGASQRTLALVLIVLAALVVFWGRL